MSAVADPSKKHFFATAVTIVGAFALDVAGRLSPQAHSLALAAVGAFGLSAAVEAFKQKPGAAAELESALAELAAKHMPDLLSHVAVQVEAARRAFEGYLEKQLGPGGQQDDGKTPAETPAAKTRG